jgi:hypothetical protein
LSNSEDPGDLREPTRAEIEAAMDRPIEEDITQVEGVEFVELDQLEPDLSSDLGTTDPMVASEEAVPYFPPTDPVLVPQPNDENAASVLGGLEPAADEEFRAGLDEDEALARTDDDLQDAVRRALALDALTHTLPIQVLVQDGAVILRGTVEHMSDAEAAESVASSVPGVIEVREELQVTDL